MDFEQAYEEHLDRVYAFLAYRLGSRADAEDLTQQTFERALRSWKQFDPGRGSHAAWLLSIARNLLIDRYRSGGAAPSHLPLDEVDPGALPTVDRAPDPGLEPELARALAALQPRDQEILALRYGAELTGPEIASMTGLSLPNVQQIISRSLRALREAMAPGSTSDSVRRSGSSLSASAASERIE